MPAVLIHNPMLMPRVAAWNVAGWGVDGLKEGGLRIVGPEALTTITEGLAEAIEVIVVAGEPLAPELVDALPNLKLVACFTTGYGNIDLAQLRTRGIRLTTAAGVNAHDVADHAMALLLALWHGLVAADARLRCGQWRDGFTPRASLRGRHAGIVGLGRIGAAVATRLAAHDLEVRWWGPRAKPNAPYARAASLLELAEWSDILILTGHADTSNVGQVDATILDRLGAQGVLINVARGSLIDEAALVQALERGTLGGAALDVFTDEPLDTARWREVPRSVLTPHIAGFTHEAGRDMARQLEENVRRHFAREPLLTPLGSPA